MTLSINDLSQGFIRVVQESEDNHIDFPDPVVQVLNIKKVESPGATDRYRVILSDGEFFAQAMLSTQMNSLVERESILRHSVIVLRHYICNVVNNKKILIALNVECLNEGDRQCPRLGSPTEYKLGPDGAPPPRANVPPTSMNQQHQQQARPQPATASDGGFVTRNVVQRSMPAQNNMPQQRSNLEPHVAVFPIKSLSPYQNKWTIRARVVTKSDIRHFTNARGEGKLFSVTFSDESGEIRATGFNEAVTVLYDLLVEGGVYYISKAPIKMAKKQYNSGIDNDYEMTLEASTDVRPLQKRDLIVVDESKFSARLTLWGRQAETFSATDNPVIAVKGARVSDFSGRCLSIGGNSSMHLNPEIQEAFYLRGWYDSEGQSCQYQTYSQSGIGAAGAGGDGGGRLDAMKTIAQIGEENLGMNEKPDWFTVCGAEENEDQFKAIVKACLWTQVVIRARAKAEYYQV
ncbi:Replication factor A protein 1 [Phlyctochytrium bullatum]|nr:Replication factor A protein 1 [Phlyctochytrium bullatum]